MVSDFDVTVKSEDVDNLVRAIRSHADGKALRRELARGLNSATKRVRGQMIEVIPAALPRRGGLAAQFEDKVKGNASAKSGRWPGVSIWYRAKGHDVRTLTGKRLRHPVFGNRSVWVNQTAGVDPAVFFAEFDKQKPDVQRAIVAVLEDVARKVTNI